MKYSVYDSLFFKYPSNMMILFVFFAIVLVCFLHSRSILIFALSLFLGTCAFCGFIGFVHPFFPFSSDLQ